LDTLPNPKLVAKIGKNQVGLSNWHRCPALVEVDGLGHCHIGPHYHFVCEA
jgi:hypothetical protein